MEITPQHPHVTDYLTHLALERRVSEHTCKNYRFDLESFQAYLCTTLNLPPDKKLEALCWESITPDNIRAWIIQQRQKNLSPRSLNRSLSALRGFFQYLIREGIIEKNPAQVLKAMKTKKSLPKPLDVDQIHCLLDHHDSGFQGTRDHALMELIYSAGLRVSEAAQLNLEDLDLDSAQVRVLGKRKKVRIGILGKRALHALNIWLKERALFTEKQNTALFINSNGTRISIRSIQLRIKKAGLKQGILGSVHPHRLRHSFASHLLESSGDLRAVQELLGHSALTTTEIYTQVNFQKLAQIYDQTHPRAFRKRNIAEHVKGGNAE